MYYRTCVLTSQLMNNCFDTLLMQLKKYGKEYKCISLNPNLYRNFKALFIL